MRRTFALILLTNIVVGCTPQTEGSSPAHLAATEVATPIPDNNSEMAEIFEADQAIRKRLTPENWGDPEFVAEMENGDAARKKQVRKLLEDGALQTGADFYHAAFIFQHADTPEDYLLAHTLATVSAAKGYEGAAWIAAATLDRYLFNMKQPQIYGTQTLIIGGAATMEPYNRKLIPDALRQALGVPSLETQEERLAETQKAFEK